ncbi:Multicopper oxidase with three cupredoxin domains (includes cell division protein FtsP and spore coat protein CotA) [Streptosporangium subroseum]|uniref:Multicopper oxidase with three cupredoxin domains (Includes cell division protein FtsP and spore coat protein CotA) n=1 Tax=Streptosporangium subroseum TaxID=106412 RepID=A0A239MDQ9_9ACTN|nr:multicopper oxidase family protein [Streptosporangium subroseum]SNT39969.1 Multicopper oxidase with three cupredoxin domains (includes cell division protein FtsP and spore coat protein CotA) [Streptosporangium subroseum]
MMRSRIGPACLAAALAITTVSGSDAGPSPPPPVREGAPLRDPPQLVSHNGILRARLVVEGRQVDVAGRKLWALTYNGHYMPPTLRIRPGDRLELAMENRLGKYTNLHVHGLHVSPSGHSDNVFVHIHPGQTFHYSYRFPANLASGTYWYHSHAHPMSGPQVAGGLSGIIVVDGLKRYLPPDLRDITEHVIALKDFQIQGNTVKTKDLHISAPTNRTVNGQLNPTIRIRPGEIQLWRLSNISANIYYKVRLQGQPFQVIAHDANPVNRIWAADSLLLAAGARFDVLVRGGPPGRTQLQTLPYNTGPAGNRFPQATLATLVSEGALTHPTAPPTTFAPTEDLSHAVLAARRTVVFSENKAGTEYYINGRQFDPNRVDIRSKLNTVEEWTVRNDSNEEHSFHVHTNDFQLMSINGRPHEGHGWQDTVSIPPNGQIVIRMPFTDYTGRTVLHCHILNHEDAGMMAVLEIVK